MELGHLLLELALETKMALSCTRTQRTTTWDLANDATLVYVEYSIAMYSYARTDWIGYDGPISIRKKIEYAKHEGLGRYFLWALGYDKNWTLSSLKYRYKLQAHGMDGKDNDLVRRVKAYIQAYHQ
ncbi:hypothetical protein ACOSQ2_012724 [Xanthoceras sorbifolium]